MSDIWFTSDTHFGHRNIIKYCNRPFSDVPSMDAEMVRRFNSRIKPDDSLIHLGDVAMGNIAESLPMLNQINGIKFLVPGNHDRVFSGESESRRARFDSEYKKVFNMIWNEQLVFSLRGIPFVISHFPYVGDSHGKDRYADKRPEDKGLPIVHGHVHDEWKENGRMLNVGVDVWDFYPVHGTEVAAWLDRVTGTA